MKLYHITPYSNLSNIFEVGIRPSLAGADGPGVYAWRGDLCDALENATYMMFDGPDFVTNEHLKEMDKLAILQIELQCSMEDDDIFETWVNVAWDDYLVLRDGVLPNEISMLGKFSDLFLEYFSQHIIILLNVHIKYIFCCIYGVIM